MIGVLYFSLQSSSLKQNKDLLNLSSSTAQNSPSKDLDSKLNISFQQPLNGNRVRNHSDTWVSIIYPVTKRMKAIEKLQPLSATERIRIERKLRAELVNDDNDTESYSDILGAEKGVALEAALTNFDSSEKRASLTKSLSIWSETLAKDQEQKIDKMLSEIEKLNMSTEDSRRFLVRAALDILSEDQMNSFLGILDEQLADNSKSSVGIEIASDEAIERDLKFYNKSLVLSPEQLNKFREISYNARNDFAMFVQQIVDANAEERELLVDKKLTEQQQSFDAQIQGILAQNQYQRFQEIAPARS